MAGPYVPASDQDNPSWPVKDIIYVSVVGPVLAAAFLEWFLWLAAFLYCLYKVFVKANHWTVKFLAVIMMLAFTALRGIFLPVMVVTLPLPRVVTRHFPAHVVSFLQWFAFWTFAVLLIVPWLFCVYRLATNSLGRAKRIKEVLDERSAPKTVIVMPVYKEEPAVLIKAIDSVVDCDYPASCIHVFLSYDGGLVDEPYLKVISHLGIPITLKSYPTSIDVTYKGARITVSRFKHGGKRHCQKQTFKLVDKVYAEYLRRHDNLFLLFIDSDCILDRVCLQNFMYDMELKPGSNHDMLAMTGVITSTTAKNSLITVLQDMEYIHGQLFERSVESGCGAVTCLPGALTMLRFSAFRRMAKYYFAEKAEHCEDLFDFGKCHLGEDRWLTHLFMVGAKKRYQIQMCTSAFCKTEAVQSFKSLLKQRRRWFLGFITNEVCMLTDLRLWIKYPMLCLVRFMQNTIRTTALLFFIMVISVITTSNRVQNLPVGFIAVSLGLNYLLMIYFGAKLKRFKAWLYPIMFILNPFFNWLYMVYGIFTAGQRTWGGPRADAAKADEKTTPDEVVTQAVEEGNELNIDFETFKPVADGKTIPIHPWNGVVGKFAARTQRPDGFYGSTFSGSALSLPTTPTHGLDVSYASHRRCSTDSDVTSRTGTTSIALPRRVESLVGDHDHSKIHLARSISSKHSSTYGIEFEEPKIGLDGVADIGPPESPRGSPKGSPRESPRGRSPASSTRRASLSAYPHPPFLPEMSFIEPPAPVRAGRSPLGRFSLDMPRQVESEPSPLRDDIFEPGFPSPESESPTRTETDKGRKKRRRLSKRPPDPGDMV